MTSLGPLATLVRHWLGDCFAPGLPSTNPTPAFFFFFFFSSEEEGGSDYFLFSAELRASETASKDLSFGSFPPAPSSHFGLSGVPSPGPGIVWCQLESWATISLLEEPWLFTAAPAHWPDTHNFLCLQSQGPPTTPPPTPPSCVPAQRWAVWVEGCTQSAAIPHMSPVHLLLCGGPVRCVRSDGRGCLGLCRSN